MQGTCPYQACLATQSCGNCAIFLYTCPTQEYDALDMRGGEEVGSANKPPRVSSILSSDLVSDSFLDDTTLMC